LTILHPDAAWINNPVKDTIPTAETPTADTLISSDAEDNVFNYGYFYTFENEVGESAASQIQLISAQKGWAQWRFFEPDASGDPTTTPVTDPKMAMDQLVAILPEAVFDEALLQNARRWNLYMFTWSNQDVVPPEGIIVGSRDLDGDSTYQEHGWIANTAAIDIGTSSAPLPSE